MKCFSCNGHFHVICAESGTDKVACKTTIQNILFPSAKSNFVFFCDGCRTELEIDKANSDAKRLDMLEGKMTGVDKKLNDIMTMLASKSLSEEKSKKTHHPVPVDNIWADKERLASVKAPEPKAVLVINKITDPTKDAEMHEIVEKIVVNNDISLAESHKSKEGDLVLVCRSEEARNELKTMDSKRWNPDERPQSKTSIDHPSGLNESI